MDRRRFRMPLQHAPLSRIRFAGFVNAMTGEHAVRPTHDSQGQLSAWANQADAGPLPRGALVSV